MALKAGSFGGAKQEPWWYDLVPLSIPVGLLVIALFQLRSQAKASESPRTRGLGCAPGCDCY